MDETKTNELLARAEQQTRMPSQISGVLEMLLSLEGPVRHARCQAPVFLGTQLEQFDNLRRSLIAKILDAHKEGELHD